MELCDSGTWGDESPDGLPLLRSTNMQNGQLILDDLKIIDVPKNKIERYLLREGDILITKSSGSVDHIGKSLYITKEMDGKYGFSNFTQRLRVDKKQVLPRWIYLRISNPATRDFLLNASQTTTGLRNLKILALKELEIPLPPLEVQKEIVARLESLLAKISEAKKLRAEARESADNLLSAELHKIFDEGKKKGWEEKNIGDPSIMKMTSGGTPSKSHPEYYGGEIRWLKSGELDDNENITNSEDYITEEGLKKSSAKLFPPHTVFLAMYGATAGKLGILGIEASTNQAVAGMICRPEKLHHKFLFYSLMGIRDEIIADAWGGAQPNLSQTIIKRFSVVLPPLAEQKKIVARLDALSQKIEAIKELQDKTENQLGTLESSVLSKAFSG